MTQAATAATYYDVLGLTRGASAKDVRRAYRQQALRCHPDKNGGAGDADFKRVREAYEVLSDERRRGWYDATLDGGFDCRRFDFKTVLRMAKECLDRGRRTVRVKLPVTIEDIWHKRIKKMDISVKRYSAAAQGLEARVEQVYISLCSFQKEYRFPHKGDDCKVPIFPAGDLVVTLDVLPHPRLRIDDLFGRYDLYTTARVTLYQHCCQASFEVPTLDGQTVTCDNPGKAGLCVLRGQGLPYARAGEVRDEDEDEDARGDLYVSFEVVLPDPRTLRLEDGGGDLARVLREHFDDRRAAAAAEEEGAKDGKE